MCFPNSQFIENKLFSQRIILVCPPVNENASVRTLQIQPLLTWWEDTAFAMELASPPAALAWFPFAS